MKTYNVFWGPTGHKIATVQAKTMKAAKRKAPQPYRKYLGEIYVEEVKHNPSSIPKEKWIPATAVKFNRNGSVSIRKRSVSNPSIRKTKKAAKKVGTGYRRLMRSPGSRWGFKPIKSKRKFKR